eukprot:1047991-Rhodomonas_salina.1
MTHDVLGNTTGETHNGPQQILQGKSQFCMWLKVQLSRDARGTHTLLGRNSYETNTCWRVCGREGSSMPRQSPTCAAGWSARTGTCPENAIQIKQHNAMPCNRNRRCSVSTPSSRHPLSTHRPPLLSCRRRARGKTSSDKMKKKTTMMMRKRMMEKKMAGIGQREASALCFAVDDAHAVDAQTLRAPTLLPPAAPPRAQGVSATHRHRPEKRRKRLSSCTHAYRYLRMHSDRQTDR